MSQSTVLELMKTKRDKWWNTTELKEGLKLPNSCSSIGTNVRKLYYTKFVERRIRPMSASCMMRVYEYRVK